MNKLVKKLKLIKGFDTANYNIYRHVFEAIKNGSAKVLEFKILNSWYDNLEITDDKLWITYDGDTNLSFSYDKKLMCDIHVYNRGDQFNQRKFNATVSLPDSFLEVIKGTIDRLTKKHFEEKYEELLEKRKEKWIKNQISLI